MCGIAGIIDKRDEYIDSTFLNEFSGFNRFRGPDAFGSKTGVLDNQLKFGLAHHRLSIVDLHESANQPMTSEKWVIVFNGEIYNFRELRNELKKDGAAFKTSSDTEVILKLLENNHNQPKDAFNKLEGMFAIAALNTQNGELLLARDKWGKKPLYFYLDDNHLSFSSDIRSFSKLNKKFSINLSALKYYFCELSMPQPETIFNEITQVTPGTYVRYSKGNLDHLQFADLFDKSPTKPIKKTTNPVDEVRNLLSKGIESSLQADVPVGAFLSGGIDSGLIVGLSTEFSNNLNTYTVGFNDKQFDERPFAELVAKKFKTNHCELLIDTDDINLEELVLEFGEPFADSSMIPSFLISKTVSNHQKVVLSGDGGDELFCGNNTYKVASKFEDYQKKVSKLGKASKLLKYAPSEKLKTLEKIKSNPVFFSARELYRNIGFKESEVNNLFEDNNSFSLQKTFEEKIIEANSEIENIFKQTYNGAIRTRLLNDYLVKIDRASMFASLEIRSPFLDDSLFKFVNHLKSDEIMCGGKLKYLLKEISKDLLPPEILNKPKTGFAIPLDNWLRNKWKDLFIEEVFNKKQDLVELNYNYIQKIWKEHLNGSSNGHKLFAILVFHIWTHNYSN